MSTSTNIINDIIADLERQYEDAGRNYKAASAEWNKARKIQNEIEVLIDLQSIINTKNTYDEKDNE